MASSLPGNVQGGNNSSLSQTIQWLEMGHRLQLISWGGRYLASELDNDSEKGQLQANLPHEGKCKSPLQNNNKRNPSTSSTPRRMNMFYFRTAKIGKNNNEILSGLKLLAPRADSETMIRG